MTLLYEAALKTNVEGGEDRDIRPFRVNPTAGVSQREAPGRAVFVVDISRPGGGYWVAETDQDKADSGVPSHLVEILAPTPTVSGAVTSDAQLSDTRIASQDLTSNWNLQDGSLPSASGIGKGQTTDGEGPDRIVQDLFEQNDRVQELRSNVNPQMNAGGEASGQTVASSAGVSVACPLEALLISQPTVAQVDPSFDPNFLDALPLSNFDWSQWDVSQRGWKPVFELTLCQNYFETLDRFMPPGAEGVAYPSQPG